MAVSKGHNEKQRSAPPIDPDRIKEAESAYGGGDLTEARRLALSILADDPAHPAAINIAALSAFRQGDADDAIRLLIDGCRHHPANAALHANLGRIFMQRKKPLEAAEYLVHAVNLDPHNGNYKSLYASSAQHVYRTAFNPDFKKATQTCLEDSHISYGFLMTNWLSLLKLDPSYEIFWTLMHCQDYETFRDSVQIEDLKPCLDDRFLQLGIWRLSVSFWPLEKILTHLRRYSLEKRLYENRDYLPFLSALALHCFFNEYAFDISAEEEKNAADLYDKVSVAGPITPALDGTIAMAGCYRQLSPLPNAAAIAGMAQEHGLDLFRALARTQISEPLEEQDIRKTIPMLRPLEDDVSQAVRQQYEENPYPRWMNINNFTLPQHVKDMAKGKKILVAGCGTGQEVLMIARYFPLAAITAIDLSLSSLAYAIRKAREYGIGNINFTQADLLDLDGLSEDYDMIVCSGVLHHMKDPVRGMRKLLDHLKPGGSFKIAVYSTLARRHLKLCQDWIKEEKIPATPDGIRRFRRMALALPPDDPKRKVVGSLDFYSLSQCRDLVFHVQEHTFTLPELKNIFGDLGIQVTRFILSNAAAVQEPFKKMFPGDVDTKDLDIWHQFETAYPDTFISMYNILLCRTKDRDTLDESWIDAAMNF